MQLQPKLRMNESLFFILLQNIHFLPTESRLTWSVSSAHCELFHLLLITQLFSFYLGETQLFLFISFAVGCILLCLKSIS